jgi:hypothetical protein
MDADRSQIIDPGNSSLNKWLIDTAANMTAELLSSDWFPRFGANAYVAAANFHGSLVTKYEDAVLYDAGGKTPTVRAFPDPVALLRQGALRLDLESLKAEIEPL